MSNFPALLLRCARIFWNGLQIGFYGEVVRWVSPIVQFCEQARDDADARCNNIMSREEDVTANEINQRKD